MSANTTQLAPVTFSVANSIVTPGAGAALASVVQPLHGTASVSADGLSITWTPNDGFVGDVLITFNLDNDFGQTGTGQATVSVGE